MPSDVDAAADEVLLTDSRISELWWNESDGLVTKDHRQIAFLILQHQNRTTWYSGETLVRSAACWTA